MRKLALSVGLLLDDVGGVPAAIFEMSKDILIRTVIGTDMHFEVERAPGDRFELNDAARDSGEALETPDHGPFAKVIRSVELPDCIRYAKGQSVLLLPRMRRPSSIMSASAMDTPWV